MPLPGNMGQISFPFLWLSEPYFPMHWFTSPSFSTVRRTELVLVLRLRTPPLLWFCTVGAGIPGAQSQSWSPGEAEESQIISSCSVCEGEKVFKSQCQVRGRVRDSWVGVGANWRVKPLGRCTPLFQEEFDVNQWSLNAWVNLGHFLEGRRRILKPAPKLQFGAKPTHVSQAWPGAEGAILTAFETVFLGGCCPHRGASKSACLLVS